ncbi:MAG: penicillin-binding protein [Fidelibacterota bacterium]
MKDTLRHIKYKSLGISLIFLLFWGAIVLRLFSIQVKNNATYRNYSLNMSHKKKEIPAQRGLILDRNGKGLAINIKNYGLAVHPHYIDDKQQMARKFSKFLNIPYTVLLNKFNAANSFVWIDRNISSEAADSIKNHYGIHRAIYLEEKIKRQYPYNDLAGQTLGFTNVDNVGLEGLEKVLDDQLSGVPGHRIYFRTGKGNYEPRPNLPYKAPENGKNIELTIDIEYQNILHEEILTVLQKYNADKAMGILIDPNSGEILAMASAPVIDPNNYAAYPRENRKNILVTDVFEPGSTFKIITAAAALEEGAVTPGDTIDTDKGYIVIQRRTIHDHETLPDMPFSDVIRHSSNVGIIRVAQKMGNRSLFHYVRKFGFGSQSNIKMPGEVNGIMKNIDGWTPLRTAQISMGQGISCTAIQLVYAYAAIANGGLLLRPQIVKTISDNTGQLLLENRKTVIRRVASPQTTSTIRNLLLNTVEAGTGRKANIQGMDIAGKTGTAQKIKPEGGYSKTDYIASFVGFFPARNPKLLCAVIVDNPRGGIYYGGTVSAPVVKNVFKRVVNMSEDLFFEDMLVPQNKEAEDTITEPGQTVIFTGNITGSSVANFPMPNLIGMSSMKAIQFCNARGLTLKLEGSGKVVAQQPPRGKIVSKGEVCHVTLSIKG